MIKERGNLVEIKKPNLENTIKNNLLNIYSLTEFILRIIKY